MTRGGSFAVRPAPEEGAGVLPNGTKGKERIFIELRVYAKYFFYLYTIEDFTELTIDRYNLGVSQLRLSVDRRSPSACFLQLGNWLQRAGVHEFYAIQQLEVDVYKRQGERFNFLEVSLGRVTDGVLELHPERGRMKMQSKRERRSDRSFFIIRLPPRIIENQLTYAVNRWIYAFSSITFSNTKGSLGRE